MKIFNHSPTALAILISCGGFPLACIAADEAALFSRQILQQELEGSPKQIYITSLRAQLTKIGVPVTIQESIIQRATHEFESLVEEMSAGSASMLIVTDGRQREQVYQAVTGKVEGILKEALGENSVTLGKVLLGIASKKGALSMPNDPGFIGSMTSAFTGEYQPDPLSNAFAAANDFFDACLGSQVGDDTRQTCSNYLANVAGIALNMGLDQIEATHPEIGIIRDQSGSYNLAIDLLTKIESGMIVSDSEKKAIVDAIGEEIAQSNLLTNQNIEHLGNKFDDFNADVMKEITASIGNVKAINQLVTADAMKIQNELEKNSSLFEENVKNTRQMIAQQLKEKQAQRKAIMMGINALAKIDAELAHTSSIVVGATFDLQDAVDAYNAAAQQGAMATAALSMNVVSIALSVFSAFSSQNQGPSPEVLYMQAIMEQVRNLQKQISSLREAMDGRFDYVDARLDGVFSAINAGFEAVIIQNNTNLAVALDGIKVGLDTQSLLLAESQRVVDLIKDFELGPCVDWWAQSQVAMPDDKYSECAIKLRNYASDGIIKDQLTTNPFEISGSSLSKQFESAGSGRITGTLQRIFSALRGASVDTNKISSPESWIQAASMYRNFLMASPAQAQKVLTNPSMSDIADGVHQIISFKSEVLEAVKNSIESPDGYNSNGNSPIDVLIRSADNLVAQVDALVADETADYEAKNRISRLGLSRDELPEVGNNSVNWKAESKGENSNSVPYAGNVIQALMKNIDPAVRGVIVASNGVVSVNTLWKSNSYVYVDCSKYSSTSLARQGVNAYDLVDFKDNYEVQFEYVDSYGSNHRLLSKNYDLTGIGAVVHPYVHPDDCRYDFLAPLYKWRQGMYDTLWVFDNPVHISWGLTRDRWDAWMYNHVMHTGAFTEIPDNSSIVSGWYNHKKIAAAQIASKLITLPPSGELQVLVPGITSRDEESQWLVAYFSSLMRLVLSDVVTENDAIYALASGSMRFPLLSELKREIDSDPQNAWRVAKYVRAEVAALKQFLRSQVFKNAVADAQSQISLEGYSSRVANTKFVLQAISGKSAPVTPMPPPQPSKKSSGGGGAISIIIMALLFLFRAAMGRTLNRKERNAMQ